LGKPTLKRYALNKNQQSWNSKAKLRKI